MTSDFSLKVLSTYMHKATVGQHITEVSSKIRARVASVGIR